MTVVTVADVMAETRFVVEVSEPVPAERVGEVAARIAAGFAMDVDRVRKLLRDRTGPVTKPLPQDKAERVARAFRQAGVAVRLVPSAAGGPIDTRVPWRPAPPAPVEGSLRREGARPEVAGGEPAAAVPTSSTARPPSPRAAPEPDTSRSGAVVEGSSVAVPAAPARGGTDEPPEVPSLPARAARRPGRRRAGRPGVRTYLLIALAAAFVVLLVLQALARSQAGRAAPPTVEGGMAAYADGDFVRARRVWTPLARDGDAQAQYMLGYMAENGQGRAWSNHDAAVWYRRAADQGYPQAQVALGELYLRGMGVARDPQRAAALFRAAAQGGYGPGQFEYALALFQGAGVKQDFAAALKWFEAAAASGVEEAKPYVGFAGSAGGARAKPASGGGE